MQGNPAGQFTLKMVFKDGDSNRDIGIWPSKAETVELQVSKAEPCLPGRLRMREKGTGTLTEEFSWPDKKAPGTARSVCSKSELRQARGRTSKTRR